MYCGEPSEVVPSFPLVRAEEKLIWLVRVFRTDSPTLSTHQIAVRAIFAQNLHAVRSSNLSMRQTRGAQNWAVRAHENCAVTSGTDAVINRRFACCCEHAKNLP